MAFSFGTKAETLAKLRPLLRSGRVLEMFHFSVQEYQERPAATLAAAMHAFGEERLVVRSSAQAEDGAEESHAGAFCSVLEVNRSIEALSEAIDQVMRTYRGNPYDQVLVQPMVCDVVMSGVVMTREVEHGAPYYVINYDDESGRTDSITGGVGANKTVLVYHKTPLKQLRSDRLRRVMKVVQEIEGVCGHPALDIEFAMGADGSVIVLQVRRIATASSWAASIDSRVSMRLHESKSFLAERRHSVPGLLGGRTIYGEMPDWNPAEMIGTCPCPLAASLYRSLITRSVWRLAREAMGYRRLPPVELMVMIGGHPYIDVRNSFNSFLPAKLDDKIGEKLVNAWLDRLSVNPIYHDKVEFEVAQTCYDFAFDPATHERDAVALQPREWHEFRAALKELTVTALDLGSGGSLARALDQCSQLEKAQHARTWAWDEMPTGRYILTVVGALLEECRGRGTLPFSVIARHSFIAEALMRSLVNRGVMAPERVRLFKESVCTVSKQMLDDLRGVCDGSLEPRVFSERYGHLRPGTYDISSLRYADRDDLFSECLLPQCVDSRPEFVLTTDEEWGLGRLLAEHGFGGTTPSGLFDYAAEAIRGREYAKFVFSRNVSDALEGLAEWGRRSGLNRDDVAFLRVEEILDSVVYGGLEDPVRAFMASVEKRRLDLAIAKCLRLGYLIDSDDDLFIVPIHRSAPTFISQRNVTADVVEVMTTTGGKVEVFGKVVCVENADPGFDWIFTKGIAGLITKYGGANSHMAVRCTEFGLPAAIGCGEQLFGRVLCSGRVELNCRTHELRPLYHA